jgi:hypothetical protein
MTKALTVIIVMVGLSACHAGVGIGHSHAGFRVGDNAAQQPSAVAQASGPIDGTVAR